MSHEKPICPKCGSEKFACASATGLLACRIKNELIEAKTRSLESETRSKLAELAAMPKKQRFKWEPDDEQVREEIRKNAKQQLAKYKSSLTDQAVVPSDMDLLMIFCEDCGCVVPSSFCPKGGDEQLRILIERLHTATERLHADNCALEKTMINCCNAVLKALNAPTTSFGISF